METERRALTDEESNKLFGIAYEPALSLVEMLLNAAAGAIMIFFLTMFVNYLLVRSVGFDISNLMGVSTNEFLIATASLMGLYIFGYFWWFEFASRRRYRQRRANLLSSTDLIVERYLLQTCLLVREPEHGSPMFFVQSDNGTIIFVLLGQDELDEEWEQNSLRLNDDEKPRAELKLIRDPQTKCCLLEEFSGQPLSVRQCHIINLGPGQWPESGKVIKGPWESLPKRYRLKQMPA